MLKFFYNCTLYTGNEENRKNNSFLVEDGRIKAVDQKERLEPHLPQETKKIDLEGGVATPGLVDGHTHFLLFSQQLLAFNFSDCNSLQEVLQKTEKDLKKNPRIGDWILGGGWDQNPWPEGWPNRKDLDRVTGEIPAAFYSKDHHCLWVNTKALEIAGIDSQTPDPEGGEISRDKEGQPTGILKENAKDLVLEKIPPPSLDVAREALKNGMKEAAKHGLTGVHCFEGQITLQALQQLQREEQLILRFFLGIPQESLSAAKKIGLTCGLGNESLRVGHLKVFLDGTLGSQTAAMLEPYQGSKENRGIPTMSEEDFSQLAREAVSAGIPLAIHAIGDRVNRLAVDVLENLKKESFRYKLRHRIEHSQLLTPREIPKFGKLNIVPSMQPVHIKDDQDLIKKYWGEERGKGAFATKSLIKNCAVLVLGSDAPVETIDPLQGLYYAIFRQGDNMEEALTPSEALKGYTYGPAYISGEEKIKGTIERRKLADITIFKDDFLQSPQDLKNNEILGTIMGGEFTYRK